MPCVAACERWPAHVGDSVGDGGEEECQFAAQGQENQAQFLEILVVETNLVSRITLVPALSNG